MYGYWGRLLNIDLTIASTDIVTLDPDLLRDFLGGVGLGTRLLWDMIGATTDPLGAENPLLFITGPLTGTRVPTSSKAVVCARSPLTGLLGYSVFGGRLPTGIRRAGYDGILITGRAESPCYIVVRGAEVEIRDAGELWGTDTEECYRLIDRSMVSDKYAIARIGIAGENLVRYACIVVDNERTAGRTGMGAVMGSKRLKALVVRGTDQTVPVADPDGLLQAVRALKEELRDDATVRMYSDLGSAGFVDMANMLYGSMPAGYYTVSDFDATAISGVTVSETIRVGKTGCLGCPVGCRQLVEVTEGEFRVPRCGAPEYESTCALGSLLLNDNLEALVYLNRMHNLLGIDTISGGNVLSMVYYLFDKGHITADDLDGIEPRWGDVGAAVELTRKIAHCEGVGAELALGALEFARRHGVEHLAVQVHGLETPVHDPRGFSGMAVVYATSPRGACHMTGDMYAVQMGLSDPSMDIVSTDRFANEAEVAARLQDFRCVTNSALVCHFYPVHGDVLAHLLALVTGIPYSVKDVATTGERIFTLQRLLAMRLGYDPKGEQLPELLLRPLEGPTGGHVPDVGAQLEVWYAYRDWDRETGMPSDQRIDSLGLRDLVGQHTF